MKQILLSAAVFALTATAFAQKKVADVAKFATETIDFGKIKHNVPQKGTFVVTNISNEPLIIEQASPTCGCTVSDYTKEPIAPGKTGFINATYNAASIGHVDKKLTVKFAGISEVKSIGFVGDVVAAEQFDKEKTEETPKAAAVTKEKEVAASEAKETISKTPLTSKSKSAATLKRTPVKTVKKATPVKQ